MTLLSCAGQCAMQAVPAFFGGRLAGTVYARILPQSAVQMGIAPGMELDGPRPRVDVLGLAIRGFTSRSAD